MPTVAMTEKDLRAAIRDPRDWTSGHPEREDWAAWTTEGWRALVEGSPSTGPDGQQVVHVRAYERRRGGRSHRVGAYTQLRQGGQDAEGGGRTAPGLLNVSDTAEVAEAPGGGQVRGTPVQDAPKPVLVFVGGLFDRWDHQIVKTFADGLYGTATPGRYFTWDDRAGIEAYIAGLPPGTPVRLIGHSGGADTAAQVAAAAGQAGRPLDTLVTIDPVGRGVGSGFFDRVGQGVGRWINVNAAGNHGGLDLPNVIAGIGSPWNLGPMGYAHEFVNAPFGHGSFREMMGTLLGNGRTVLDEVSRR